MKRSRAKPIIWNMLKSDILEKTTKKYKYKLEVCSSYLVTLHYESLTDEESGSCSFYFGELY